ncbi:RNA polymerase subunit sigma [Amycolatopsis sp. K13G38]|uniref:RNA polymerase subunit sigma n=1 Tax=Amycolatopsis acididurans TaxID=2724524 RepID=A0ABX1IZ00_9PSEU|nr:sigma factor-like helix-turn-helix DNA-binding protein [Amycolatopsis acididurans]NKQ52753.1 RNA polymerase subunit sigma [Amycolatopsis acididurans]
MTASAPEPETELDRLAHGAASGDATMIAGLLALLGPLLVRYCRARLGRRAASYEQADDVAQEVSYAVLAAVPGYREGPFLRIVHEIATKIVDELPPPEPAGSELSGLLPNLPSLDRDIVVLRVATGLSASDTAAVLGLSDAEVRVAQHRALSRLRSLLSPA